MVPLGSEGGEPPGRRDRRPARRRPSWLAKLVGCRDDIAESIRSARDDREEFDASAADTHAVVRLAASMVREHAGDLPPTRGSIDLLDLLEGSYGRVVNLWPAYRQALEERQNRARQGRSTVRAMKRLERPRADYLAALKAFQTQLIAVLVRLGQR